jgi:hypothetical protein
MNKDFLKTIFHSDVGHVYEYIGTVPDGLNPESPEMSAHVTEDFIKGHGDNLISTMVVQLPYQNNKIILYCNSIADVNTSDEFVLLTSLVPDVVIEPTVEETQQEETQETAQEQTQETPGEGQ